MTLKQPRSTFKAHWIRTSPSVHLATYRSEQDHLTTFDSPSQATISDKWFFDLHY